MFLHDEGTKGVSGVSFIRVLIKVHGNFTNMTLACVHAVTSVVSNSLQPHGLWPTKLLCPWDSPGKNTGVGCYALLQGIFPTQGIEPESPVVPALQADSSLLSHQGSPHRMDMQAIILSSTCR